MKASYTYDAAGRPKSTSINSGNLGTVSYDYTKSLLTKNHPDCQREEPGVQSDL